MKKTSLRSMLNLGIKQCKMGYFSCIENKSNLISNLKIIKPCIKIYSSV